MPPAGRKPNQGQAIRHRVKPVHDWTEIEDAPFPDAPPMPDGLYGIPWPAETQRWWEVVSRMPHCVIWQESDWQFAIDTIAIHARFVRGESASAATELRNREKVLGTTLDFRRDLRIRYVAAGTAAAKSAGVVAIEDYQQRLVKKKRRAK